MQTIDRQCLTEEGHVIVDVLEEGDLYPVVEDVPVEMP